MGLTLQQTINFCQPYIEYSPLNAGIGFEPSLTIGTTVRDVMLTAPFQWPWNRNEYVIGPPNSPVSLTQGVQDYIFAITDFAYLEKISLITADGSYGYELTDVYNTSILGISGTVSDAQSQPKAAAVKYYTPGTNVAIRFLAVPDQAYTGLITYQKAPVPFQVFNMESVNEISGVAYYNFSSTQGLGANNAFANQTFQVQGFDIAANNGTFTCTASTSSYLILNNPNAVNDAFTPGTAINESWFPIPDSFADVFSWLFLAEALETVDDSRGMQYRQRGIASLLAKSHGLSDMQVNAFLEQYIKRGSLQELRAQLMQQQSVQARGV